MLVECRMLVITTPKVCKTVHPHATPNKAETNPHHCPIGYQASSELKATLVQHVPGANESNMNKVICRFMKRCCNKMLLCGGRESSDTWLKVAVPTALQQIR